MQTFASHGNLISNLKLNIAWCPRSCQAELAALDGLGGSSPPLDTRRLAEHDAANAAATPRRIFGYRPRRSEAASPAQVRPRQYFRLR